jgi:trimethyllysine dioxygenase
VLGQGKEWKEGDVKRWYDAARAFDRIVRSEEAEYWAPLKPGTLLGECGLIWC